MKPDQIKRLRYSILHLNQGEFSQVAGTSIATVGRWEKGRAKPAGMSRTILDAVQQAVDNHGEERIRGVDWAGILEKSGLLVVLRGILSFATTRPEPPPEDQESL